MKIIPKLQLGGITYTPYQIPLLANSWYWADLQVRQQGQLLAATLAATTGSSSKDSLLTKDMLNNLYKNGLPNDVDAFLLQVDAFSSQIMGGQPSVQEYRLLMSGLNKVTYNKEVFDKALSSALSKGILQQPAIDSNGYIYLKTGFGNVTKKRVSSLSNSDLSKILSYGELAELRANDPSTAFDGGTIANIISSGISVTDVFKTIQDFASKVGTDTISREDIKLKSSKALQDAIEGIQEVMSEPDGVYKFHEKTSTQRHKAEIGMRYILESLTPLLRATIELLAKLSGVEPLLIIADGINYQLKETTEYSLNWQKYKEDDGSGSGSGSGKGKTYEMNQLMQIVTGDGLQHLKITITPGRGLAYQVDGQVISWIPKAEGNGTVGPGSAVDAILTSQLGRILNTNAIHVGEQRIDATLLSKMYYDGSNAHAVWLPVKYDNNQQPMPNFDLIENYEKALKEINRRGGMGKITPEQVNQIFKQFGLGDYFNPDGSLNERNFMRFIGISLLGDESVFKDADELPGVFTKLDDEYTENQFSIALGSDKKHPYKIDGDLYRATAYIPIYDSLSNARVASGQSPWALDPGYVLQQAEELAMNRRLDGPQMKNQLSKSQLQYG